MRVAPHSVSQSTTHRPSCRASLVLVNEEGGGVEQDPELASCVKVTAVDGGQLSSSGAAGEVGGWGRAPAGAPTRPPGFSRRSAVSTTPLVPPRARGRSSRHRSPRRGGDVLQESRRRPTWHVGIVVPERVAARVRSPSAINPRAASRRRLERGAACSATSAACTEWSPARRAPPRACSATGWVGSAAASRGAPRARRRGRTRARAAGRAPSPGPRAPARRRLPRFAARASGWS
jgi:hypothetical protein